ncbi:cytochrome c oxidase subunit 6a, mitochondrial [Physcomitrium patens]|uniref:Uncharacterized protein n=1 Tax=Physcomitrium patens TaxID=3218 RepID=A9S794_PHYPA|nr:cytochrome c oxidase subunit 6a, mitochondrial-like isoform X1 [Physcomitrium patens]PNR53078.1 hypothetical protein PHYPA_009453 [Physcomitrium patens]|eukprot:XP_024377648.1 cytochrome c oxidase subunit 6a, mitochondrial-like isoform X1 [Physcomitrella patens]
MANLVRQRLGALLSRPISSPLGQTAQTGAASKRFFASKSHAHDDAEETAKWRSITIAAYIMCIGMGIYILANEEHGHDGEKPGYSYLHIRNKQFPWGPDGLFEYKHEGHYEH